MDYSHSLKRITLFHSEPHMPIATYQRDISDGRTRYPEIDPPSHRLKDYHRRQASINLSTERSMNIESNVEISSKKLLFPLPAKPIAARTLDLSMGDYSRKNTESQRSENFIESGDNAIEGGDQYERGEQATDFTEPSQAKGCKFKKYQSQSQLPTRLNHYKPKTEAEIRMESRYINGLNRQLKLRHEEEQMVRKMVEFNTRKARILKNATTKVENKKLFNKTKRQDQYDRKFDCRKSVAVAENPNKMRSVSLPQIKKSNPNIIDATIIQPVQVNTREQHELHQGITKRDDIIRLKENLQNVLQLTGVEITDNFLTTILKSSLSSTKFYLMQPKHQNKQQFEQGMRMMKVIEENFRRKGIAFDPKALKKAFMVQDVAVEQLTKFPESALVSNPYYKRWGL